MTELAKQEHTWTQQQLHVLKNTIQGGASDDEFAVFCYAIKRTGLDPFMRQIYAVKRGSKMTIQVGIDGYRLIADRTGKYAGNDEPVFDDEQKPSKATVTVYKLVQGIRCAFTASARWDEYYPGQGKAPMWEKMPCVMLGKVAESLALRKAFPAELSGLYTEEEMEQADSKAYGYKTTPAAPSATFQKALWVEAKKDEIVSPGANVAQSGGAKPMTSTPIVKPMPKPLPPAGPLKPAAQREPGQDEDVDLGPIPDWAK